jgi:hypothetical protein
MFIGTPHQEVLLATCQYPRLMTHPEGLLQIPRYASLPIPTLFPTQVFIQITNNPALGVKSSSGRDIHPLKEGAECFKTWEEMSIER